MTTEAPLVRIVDDNRELLDSLAFMLRCEGYDVAAYESAAAFLAADSPSRGGCLVLDVQMPGLSGIELFNVLGMRGYDVPIIFLTAHADVDMAVYVMREGACDFHQKPMKPETFLPAVARAVARDRAKKGGMTDLQEEVRRWRSLTDREEEIARLVGGGFVSRTIGERLSISRRTVDHYRASGLKKLGLSEPADIAAFFERIDAWREKSAAAGVSVR
ncbi:response regulator transcription factor [Sutterella sp.]|uniref:response regulator transcription factor n=1 Tax=Sutterella sp. TaxID=1981025 RepID=UPI0025F5D11A|nr:response regulator [uncultured Sutterella sp.]